jgi:hypothetical protein
MLAEYAKFVGFATPPTSYGGYGGNANELPKWAGRGAGPSGGPSALGFSEQALQGARAGAQPAAGARRARRAPPPAPLPLLRAARRRRAARWSRPRPRPGPAGASL